MQNDSLIHMKLLSIVQIEAVVTWNKISWQSIIVALCNVSIE